MVSGMTAHPQEFAAISVATLFFKTELRTAQEVSAAGISMRKLKPGKYRNVFEIVGADAIVKIPKRYTRKYGDKEYDDPLFHARKEILTITRINSDDSMRHLRAYLPLVYYSSLETGVIMMKKYRALSKKDRIPFKREERLLVRIFRETLRMWTADYGLQNLMRDEKMNPVVVDLGY